MVSKSKISGYLEDKSKLPGSIWALGFVSLLMDISSETIHGILPVFLVSVLGASVASVGFLEGVSEALVLVVKVFSGTLSDRFGKRKPIVLFGYSLAAICKPFFALANSLAYIYAARFLDRIGKGIRGAPRDALIADIVLPEQRGSAFGLRQSLDTIGAFIGPMVAILLMTYSNGNYRLVFWLATLPAVLSIGVLIFGVQETEKSTTSLSNKKISWQDLKKFSRAFWMVFVAGGIFQLARFSEAFLILRAKEVGLGLEFAPVVLIVMNLVYSLTAFPVGRLSDRFPREWFLLLGLIILFLSDLTLAFGGNLVSLLMGIGLWGLHLGFTQGVFSAMVADHCEANLRGTAYGIFNLVSAVALLMASSLAGILWTKLGSSATFITGAFFALFSFVFYLLISNKIK